MKITTWRLVNTITFFAVLMAIFQSSVQAQRTTIKGQKRAPAGVTLVFCNERDTLRDYIGFPADAKTIRGRTYLTAHYLLSDVKGRYNFMLRSPYNFSVLVRRKSGSRGKWSTVRTASSKASYRRSAGIQPYYYWNYLRLTQSGNARDHNEFGVVITPTVRNQSLVGSWNTSRCAVTPATPSSTRCQWVRAHSVYGIPTSTFECRCGGKISPAIRCGKRP